METKIQVSSLSHEEIVNIISTAFYGNTTLEIDYSCSKWEKLPKKTEDPCFEDKIADLLEQGESVIVYDYEEDEKHRLFLCDILKACSTKEGYEYAVELLVDEQGDFWTAYNLIQIAVFGEVVYG